MTHKASIEFKTISSDDNLFDFEMIVKKVRKAMGLSDEQYITKIRQYFEKKFPSMSGMEHASIMGAFIMTEMSFKHLCDILEVLGVPLSLNVVVDVPGSPMQEPIPVTGDVNLMDAPIAILYDKGLPTRILNCLRYPGQIRTIGELVRTDKETIMKIRNMGVIGTNKLLDVLKPLGLTLGMKLKK